MMGITARYVAEVDSSTISARRGSLSMIRETSKDLRQKDRIVGADYIRSTHCNCVSEMLTELKEISRKLHVTGTTS